MSPLRVRHEWHRSSKDLLQHLAALAELAVDLVVRERRQVSVREAVRAEADARLLHVADLFDGERSQGVGRTRNDPVDLATARNERLRHDEHRGRHAAPAQDRQRVLMERSEPVVEGERGQPARQSGRAVERAHRVVEGHDRSMATQPRNVPRKGTRADGKRRLPCDVDGVVAEDGHRAPPDRRRMSMRAHRIGEPSAPPGRAA